MFIWTICTDRNVFFIDIHQRYQNLCHLYSGMEKLGSLGFSHNQNNCGSTGGSGAYVTCIYPGPSVKINTCKTLHGTQRSWAHLFLCVFLRVWSAKTRRPQFEPHGWRHHYTRWHRRSGISGVYLWYFFVWNFIYRLSACCVQWLNTATFDFHFRLFSICKKVRKLNHSKPCVISVQFDKCGICGITFTRNKLVFGRKLWNLKGNCTCCSKTYRQLWLHGLEMNRFPTFWIYMHMALNMCQNICYGNCFKGALDKYNIYLLISYSIEHLKLNQYWNFQLILRIHFHFMRYFVNSIISRVSYRLLYYVFIEVDFEK